MDKMAVEQIVKTITPELTWLFIQGFIALFVFSYLKDSVTSLSNYLKLRFSLWGLNTKLLIEGKVGYIKAIKFKEVEVRINSEQTMYVPIDKFLKMTKVVYHNGYTGEEK
jgi:hypothetical protein